MEASMALARCSKHGYPEGRGGNIYSREPVKPLGYPDTATMCGRTDCSHPALIWLLEGERAEYDAGRRIFGYDSKVARVRVA